MRKLLKGRLVRCEEGICRVWLLPCREVHSNLTTNRLVDVVDHVGRPT